MAAVAHSPAFAKKVGVPQSVGKDFSTADKGKTFKRGGDMATKKMNPFAKFEASAKDKAMDKKEMGIKKMASGGITSAKMSSVRTAAPSRDGVASKGKTKGTMVSMKGSTPLGMKRGGKC